MSNNLPIRKNPRADFHDYSGGNYFITICTKNMVSYFGIIKDNNISYTETGEYCIKEIGMIPIYNTLIEVPLFVVMPNHIHLIININNSCDLQRKRSLLSIVISCFKRKITIYARNKHIFFEWQSRYYDHIIRGIKDGNKIADYIENNVARWNDDSLNPYKLQKRKW